MANAILYPSEQTFRKITSVIAAGSSGVMWILNPQLAFVYNPTGSSTGGPRVSLIDPGSTIFSGLVVKGGNTGLAAAVSADGTFSFTWNGTNTQDDAAQQTVLKGASISIGSTVSL